MIMSRYAFLLFSKPPVASSMEVRLDYKEFSDKYFRAWADSQRPEATKQDIENYLSLLIEDVSCRAFPHDLKNNRCSNGKRKIRKGMLHQLGANKKYEARILDVTCGNNVVVLLYEEESNYIDINGKYSSRKHKTLEVLELENGNVSMIRKYTL